MDFPYGQPPPGANPHGAAPGQPPLPVPQGTASPVIQSQQAQQPGQGQVPVSVAGAPVSTPGASAPQQKQQQKQQKQQKQQQKQQSAQAPQSASVQVQPQGPQSQAPPTSSAATPVGTPAASGRGRKRSAPGAAPQTPSSVNATPATVSPATGNGAPESKAGGNSKKSAGPTPAESSTPATPGPPAKKSRTNTPWTPSEELRLKQMRDAGNSWAEIAKTFPTRTEGSVKKHWYKDMHYAEFAEDESEALLNAIKEYENNKWKYIGQKVGKPAKACEQYAREHFPESVTPKPTR
ncbi:hypothetical protein TD95_005316 [Thielaviopsis punctulata]|uniref:Myb-like domain-containing protein n=1 Tax=Thielaviopsis punctulata TaxID=72032 RepID=A0A0F4ZKW7_9PEZI|nr:hypothetical protein TD95_005316 [Thielaviopsis punctulata]